MSRLEDELRKRTEQRTVPQIEDDIRKRYEARKGKLAKLAKSKDFQEYLKLEEEMNDPKIVVAHKCTDPVCESLKAKIRDFWKRRQLLEKVGGGA